MKLNICLLEGVAIQKQLAIEEALLRTDTENWCIINCGSSPAIVLGISGVLQEHLDSHEVMMPIIRRFSGGGTVVVDENTLFVTFIFQKQSLDFGQCPQKILEWTEQLYQPVFHPEPFRLLENDYVIGEKKIGGNAQYMTKHCWLHHTTFLWDYRPEYMQLLKMPPKMPLYRAARGHIDFIDSLKQYYPSMHYLQERLLETLSKQFVLNRQRQKEINEIVNRPHRKATEQILHKKLELDGGFSVPHAF